MKVPPTLVAMRIVTEGKTKVKIWFPIVLLWPLLLALLLLTLVVSLLVDAATLLAGHKHGYTRLVVGGLEVLAETRGTEVFVEDRNHTVALTLR